MHNVNKSNHAKKLQKNELDGKLDNPIYQLKQSSKQQTSKEHREWLRSIDEILSFKLDVGRARAKHLVQAIERRDKTIVEMN